MEMNLKQLLVVDKEMKLGQSSSAAHPILVNHSIEFATNEADSISSCNLSISSKSSSHPYLFGPLAFTLVWK
jgi:hypothetical protein